jgi:hypothetical protein
LTEKDDVKRLILSQLDRGPCCRIHLHRECCHAFGFKEPMLERSEDRRFDVPFDELIRDRLIQEIGRIGKYRFLEITKQGRANLTSA